MHLSIKILIGLILGVIGGLILLDPGQTEIIGLRMTDIEPRDGRAGPHRHAVGQMHAGRGLGPKQPEQGQLFRVVGLGRIAGRRADAAIGLAHQLIGGKVFLGRIAPIVAPHPLVQAIPDPDERAVIRLRYFDRADWESTCGVLFGDRRDYVDRVDAYQNRTYKIHGRALLNLAAVLDELEPLPEPRQ